MHSVVTVIYKWSQKLQFLKFWWDFGLRDVIANICGWAQDIVDRKMGLQTMITPVCAYQIRWTLVHKRQKIGPLFSPTQSSFWSLISQGIRGNTGLCTKVHRVVKSWEDINKIATNLPMSVQNAAIESVSVGKSLWAGTLADADDSMLLRMQDSTLTKMTILWILSNQDK